MKICFVPIDNRPVCYNLAKDIIAMDESLELFLPPRELLGDLKQAAKIDEIYSWMQTLEDIDCMILSLDTLVYGGLVPSRRGVDGHLESLKELQLRVKKLKPLLENKKVFAFSSIMRIPNNNFNDEEKEYWAEYGEKIFEISYLTHKNGFVSEELKKTVPEEIFNDYCSTRKRNFEINKMYLELKKEGLFDTLIFSKDDCAQYGFNVMEAQELEKMGGKIKTGADEIPLTLLARAINKPLKIYPLFLEPKYKNCISNYEDISIEQSVLGQINLSGCQVVETQDEADVVLVINNFIEKQGELVMDWKTEPFSQEFLSPQKPYCVADVRYTNGADNNFVAKLLPQINLEKFYGYAGWNTSANTLGSLLANVKVKWRAQQYQERAFKKLQIIRFLDDWAYQANIRKQIKAPCDIEKLMQPFENILFKTFEYKQEKEVKYIYPWNRKFEIEVIL